MHQDPVLVAEANADYACVLRSALAQAGFQPPYPVVECPEALVAYLLGEATFVNRKAYPLPSFLVLAFPAPVQFEMLRWIRSRAEYNHIQIAVLTEAEREDEAAMARNLGAQFCHPKPSNRTRLVRLSKRWMRSGPRPKSPKPLPVQEAGRPARRRA